jgi:hypothetical protein
MTQQKLFSVENKIENSYSCCIYEFLSEKIHVGTLSTQGLHCVQIKN